VHVAGMGEMRDAYNILAGKPKSKSPLGRPWGRWEDNFKTDLIERRLRLGTGFVLVRIW